MDETGATKQDQPMLQIIQVSKRFEDGPPILSDVTLAVEQGEIICLLGPSGCGKTTLLRIVAGLEQADGGFMRFKGQNLAEIPVPKRNFGLMFQEFALFPHRTVGENIAFGLRMANWRPAEIDSRVAEMLSLVDLPQRYANRTIFELSGGERQRVALARSLAPGPQLLMLDEPLGNLDRALRESLMVELRAILKRLGVTAIYVTHDQTEAYAVADRIVLMRDGQIEQIGPPETVYMRPATPFVARFLGFDNLLPAYIEDLEEGTVATSIGRFKLPGLPPGVDAGKNHLLLIHPQAATILAPGANDSEGISAVVGSTSFRGDHYEVNFLVAGDHGDETLHLEIFAHTLLSLHGGALSGKLVAGMELRLALDPQLMLLLDGSE